jgi:Resolvase, N terminal domain
VEAPATRNRLLDDVRAGKVDVIVVYKVDRLTRSLAFRHLGIPHGGWWTSVVLEA